MGGTSDLGQLRIRLEMPLTGFALQMSNAKRQLSSFTGLVKQDVDKVKASFSSLGTVIGGIGLGIAAKSFIDAAVKMDSMNRSLAVTEGNALKAKQRMAEFIQTAKLPGLSLDNITSSYIKLKQVDIEGTMAMRTIKGLGNAIVAVGGGTDQLKLVIEQLVQMQGKTGVMGDDIRAIANSLPTIRKLMMQAFGTANTEALQKMGITGKEFIAKITTELEKLPKSADGARNAFDNFSDSMFQFKASMAESILPSVTAVLGKLTSLMDAFKGLSEGTRHLIGTTALVGMGGMVGLAMVGFTISQIATAIPATISAISALSKIMSASSIAASTWASGLLATLAPLGAVGLAAGSVVWAIKQIEDALKKPIDVKAINKAVKEGEVKRLTQLKTELEKQMKQIGFNPDDYISAAAEMKIKQVFPNIAPLTKVADIYKIIGDRIDELNGKTTKLQVTYKDVPMQIVQSWEDISAEFKKWTDITGKGALATPEEQLLWWQSRLGIPLTDEAKAGVINSIALLQKDILSKTEDLKKALTDTLNENINKFKELGQLPLKMNLPGEITGPGYTKKTIEADPLKTMSADAINAKISLDGLRISSDNYNQSATLTDAINQANASSFKLLSAEIDKDIKAIIGYTALQDKFKENIPDFEERSIKLAEKDETAMRKSAEANKEFYNDLFQNADEFKSKLLASADKNYKNEQDILAKFTSGNVSLYESELKGISDTYTKMYLIAKKSGLDTREIERWKANEIRKIDRELWDDRIETAQRGYETVINTIKASIDILYQKPELGNIYGIADNLESIRQQYSNMYSDLSSDYTDFIAKSKESGISLVDAQKIWTDQQTGISKAQKEEELKIIKEFQKSQLSEMDRQKIDINDNYKALEQLYKEYSYDTVGLEKDRQKALRDLEVQGFKDSLDKLSGYVNNVKDILGGLKSAWEVIIDVYDRFIKKSNESPNTAGMGNISNYIPSAGNENNQGGGIGVPGITGSGLTNMQQAGAGVGGVTGAFMGGVGIGETEWSQKHDLVGGLVSAAQGAVTGAVVGSVIPVVGTAIGAGVGALIGALGNWFGRNESANARNEANKDNPYYIPTGIDWNSANGKKYRLARLDAYYQSGQITYEQYIAGYQRIFGTNPADPRVSSDNTTTASANQAPSQSLTINLAPNRNMMTDMVDEIELIARKKGYRVSKQGYA